MRTILLVDDEFPARKLLKSMLDWDKTGFTVAYEAKNGAEALEIYKTHQPDLIISDIQMPVMDGLELLSAIRRRDPNQLFIVLSCFERFDYARQVIRLGGLDYLIKDTLTPETLYTALQQAKEKLEPSTSTPPPHSGVAWAPALYAQILEAWGCDGGGGVQMLRAAAEGKGLRYMMVSILWEAAGEPPATADALKRRLESLPGFPARCGCSVTAEGTLLLFAALPRPDGDDQGARYTLLHEVKTALDCLTPVTLGVSAVHSRPEDLPQARSESEDALRYRLFLGANSILYFNPLQNSSYAVQHRHLEARIERLRGAVAVDDLAAVGEVLDKLYQTELGGVMHLNYLEYLNSILWGILTEERMLRGQLGLGVDAGRQTLDGIARLDRVEEMKAAFLGLFSALIRRERRQTSGAYSQRVRSIMAYIGGHLDQEISLESIADEFQIHKTHLARIFKEETGISLHEFIRRKRIETAKSLLLNSRYRVNEIVYKAGFKNPQNFYTLFTRYVGLTPKAFRDKYG